MRATRRRGSSNRAVRVRHSPNGWAFTVIELMIVLAIIGVIAAINTVIALFYYAAVAREMFMNPAPDGDTSPVRVPQSLMAALGITAAVTLLVGVLPNLVLHFGDLSTFLPAG